MALTRDEMEGIIKIITLANLPAIIKNANTIGRKNFIFSVLSLEVNILQWDKVSSGWLHLYKRKHLRMLDVTDENIFKNYCSKCRKKIECILNVEKFRFCLFSSASLTCDEQVCRENFDETI